MYYVSQSELADAARAVATDFNINRALSVRFPGPCVFRIHGVPRGGIPAAYLVMSFMPSFIPGIGTTRHAAHWMITDDASDADLIVDDIYDSGRTAARYEEQYPGTPFAVLFDKRREEWRNKWLVMPWEGVKGKDDASADDIATRLLQYIGEDVDREGLRETPQRFLKAWKEWTSGYKVDPASVLKTFEDGKTDEMVVVHNIPVVSKCEHHLADILGHAHVAYVPNGKIVGLSKLPRLVNVFARRLQVQERLTGQIADALVEHLEPKGVGVLIRASHHCMSTRGVNIHGSATTTCALRGALNEGTPRAEFLQLCAMAERR